MTLPLFDKPSTAHQTQALTHRSFGAHNNERLEFLGDAVLSLCISDWLYAQYPGLSEGELSRMRALLVREETLHQLALNLDLGTHLRLGAGEKRSGGAARASILADALEALLGAKYLDDGFAAVRDWVLALYAQLDLADLTPAGSQDAKTRLQELTQSKKWGLPQYTLVATQGAAHHLQFEVECALPARKLATRGRGGSKRAAEQDAAQLLWKALQ
jgi:ribonuclease-3